MKVTLLGDSIRQQYWPRVKELLGEGFEVWSPVENCRFAQYTLRGLFDWRENMKGSDIVHFNCGHWDLTHLFGDGFFTDEEYYVKTMLRIVDILKSRYRCVIFATTTPVRLQNRYNKNEDVDRFNQLIAPLLAERGVIINDLNSLLRNDIDRYISEDTIHLSEEGLKLCSEQVARVISEVAKSIDASPKAEAKEINDAGEGSGAPVLI